MTKLNRYLKVLEVIGVLLTQFVSIKAAFPQGTGASGLIFFNRSVDMSSSEFYRTILAIDVLTGEESPVTPDNDVSAISWSHDKTRILAAQMNSEFPASLVILDADGKNRRPLISFRDLVTSGAQWSPDDQRIVFWGNPVQANPRYWAIFDIAADGTGLRRLTERFDGYSTGRLAVSPDGSQILFILDNTLFTVPANGGRITRVPIPWSVGNILEWSPDGTRIAVSASSTDRKQFKGLYLITPDGRDRRLLIPYTEGIAGPSYLQWSPDGSQLLFATRASDVNGYISLSIVTRETGEISRYQAGEGVLTLVPRLGEAVWSPDRTEIVFSAGAQPYSRNLYRVDREFTWIQRLTQWQGRDDVIEWRP